MAWSLRRSRVLLAVLTVVGIAGGTLALRQHAPGVNPEKSVILKGLPVFQSGGTGGTLIAVVDQDPGKRKFLWPQSSIEAGSIQSATCLQFTFFESPPGSVWPLELVRIDDDTGTRYDASVCQIHRESMHRTRVVTLPRSEQVSPSRSIEATLFPNSGMIVAEEGMGSFEVPIWVCDSCRRERDRWLDKARRTASASN